MYVYTIKSDEFIPMTNSHYSVPPNSAAIDVKSTENMQVTTHHIGKRREDNPENKCIQCSKHPIQGNTAW